jgi:hypothetical protein
MPLRPSSSLCTPPRPMARRSRSSATRGRRGALCVSENVALIGGSVAVMRYQPPTNKRINAKRWRWSRGGRRDEGSEKARGRRRRPGTRRRRNVSSTKSERREAGRSGESAARDSSPDTMLRLNIRCLNNQARGEAMKERRKNAGIRKTRKERSFCAS